MKRISVRTAVVGACLTVLSLLSQTALGEDPPGYTSGMAAGCCDGGGIVADVELTFMKYMQEGGVPILIGSEGDRDFDLELAPRFELGCMISSDVGIRSRYWCYDATATHATAGFRLAVDAYTIDWELFHERCIGCGTELEFSCGLRYLEFKQVWDNVYIGGPGTIRDFEGWGGIFGIEAEHPLWIGNVYARGRWGVLLGDADTGLLGGLRTSTGEPLRPATLYDTTSTITELGFGYELSGDLGCWGTCSVRFGGEWQTWSNMVVDSRAVRNVEFGYTNTFRLEVLEANDVGFAGLVLGMEWRR